MKKNSNGYSLIPFFGSDIHNTLPTSQRTIRELYNSIQDPLTGTMGLFKAIQAANSSGDLKEKRRLKELVQFCTPAVQLHGGRAYKDITSFTGYMVLDFDGFDHHEGAVTFRDYLFDQFQVVIMSWLSVSGRGVRGIVRIPVVGTVEQYKALFWGFANETGFTNSSVFDSAPQNPVLPMFMSYDPDAKYRESTSVWSITGVKPSKTPIHVPEYRPDSAESADTGRYHEWSVANYEQAMSKITNAGHPQVVAAARTLGGRVGAGYVTMDEATFLVKQLVCANAYLSKGTTGYIKTAIQMLNYGAADPLYF